MHRPPWIPLAGVGLVLVASLAPPSTARANGIQSHMFLAELALERLPEGELRAVAADPALREVLLTGSVYPDSGYAVDDAYGEWSHWEPFVQAWVERIQDTYSPPFEGPDARREVAFLLGVAAHVMADQAFDNLFMRRTEEMDGGSENLDIGSDTLTVVEQMRRLRPDTWAPIAEAVAIYAERMPHEVAEDTVQRGLDRLELAMWAVIEGARDGYATYWEQMPWAATHYMSPDEPGAYPFLADVIAGYWQVLWERLKGSDDLEASVVRTVPADGAVNHAVDASSVRARSTLVFGHGIAAADLADDAVVLLDGAGDRVAASVHPGGGERNVLWVIPDDDLAYDSDYTVRAQGLPTLDGRVAHAATPVTLSFHTRCAPDRLDDCPPLPEPWERPEGPPPLPEPDAGPPRPDAGAAPPDAGTPPGSPDSGGCACGTGASRGTGPGAAVVLAVLALLLVRRRP